VHDPERLQTLGQDQNLPLKQGEWSWQGSRQRAPNFDVFYTDGSQRSNRRVPREILGGLDGDAPARAVIEEQDRLIAEKSGQPAVALKSIRRSSAK
jgi:hypothetical protein